MQPVARVVDINIIEKEHNTYLPEGTELFSREQIDELMQPVDHGCFEIIPENMTIEYMRRDRFAGEALQGLLAGMETDGRLAPENIARRAVQLADALIRELDKAHSNGE